MSDSVNLRCEVCGWVHAAAPAGEPGGTRCFRCGGRRFQALTNAEVLAFGVPRGVTLQGLTWPLPVEEPNEENGYGRFNSEREPVGEETLYAVILHLVRQSCETKDQDTFDSSAISAYERGLETLAEAGFVTLDPGGRIFGRLSPRGRKFEEWMDFHERRKRVREARREFSTVPGITPQRLARFYDITEMELMAADPESPA